MVADISRQLCLSPSDLNVVTKKVQSALNFLPLPPSPGQMTQLCELINKSGELLAKNLSHLDTVLGALDIQEHSLGVLAVLWVPHIHTLPPCFHLGQELSSQHGWGCCSLFFFIGAIWIPFPYLVWFFIFFQFRIFQLHHPISREACNHLKY